MRKLLLISFLYVALSGLIYGQYATEPNALTLRSSFINYEFPRFNELVRADFTPALEVAYDRYLSRPFHLSFPLKLGRVNYVLDEVGSSEERLYLAADALLQFAHTGEEHRLNPILFTGVGFDYTGLQDLEFCVPVGFQLDVQMGERLYLSPKLEYRVGLQGKDNLQVGVGVKILPGSAFAKNKKKTPRPEQPLPPPPDSDGDRVPDAQDNCPEIPGQIGLAGCPDADRDGITDDEDDCPTVPGIGRLQGCPDADGDGVADKEDDCPFEAGLVSNRGCPERDSDQDGVVDRRDKCPELPGDPNLEGCPDQDNDGIPDPVDECPEARGDARTNGCPDTDGDGVIDSQDRCPGSYGPVVNRGCPELTAAEQALLREARSLVNFRIGSAVLTNGSLQVLDQIADLLRRYPDYALRISGYTDDVGDAARNRQLSERRARSCYNYFVRRGINPARLDYAGFGESQPIASNLTKEGREENRRVEFDLYIAD